MNRIVGSRILVTGGAGNIGSNLVDRLILEGVKEVIVIDNLSRGRRENLKNASKSGKLKFIKGDICNFDLLMDLTRGIDYIFHEAVIRVTLAQIKPMLSHDVVATGTANVLEAGVKRKIKKLIFSSSASVYGNPSFIPIKESDPLNNLSFYGAAKIYNERLAQAYYQMFKLPFIALRPFNVYGPGMDIFSDEQEVIPVWLDRISRGLPPIIHGNGMASYDFTYISDVIEANILALISDIDGQIYNVGTGVETTLNSLAKKLIKLMNSRLTPKYVPFPESRPIIRRRVADGSKMEKDLSFTAKVSLDEGLQKMISWWKENKRLN